jgi:hypothetical protein
VNNKTTGAQAEPIECPEQFAFAQSSSLYREFLAERDEILRHKWIESEKQGRDIGFERALVDWIRNHKEKWRTSRRVTAGKTA